MQCLDAENVFGLLQFCDRYGFVVRSEDEAESSAAAAVDGRDDEETADGAAAVDAVAAGAGEPDEIRAAADRGTTATATAAAASAPSPTPTTAVSRHFCNVLRVACTSFLLRDFATLRHHPDFAALPDAVQADVLRAWETDAHVYRFSGDAQVVGMESPMGSG